MINLASMSFSFSPPSVLSIFSLLLANKSNKKHLSNCCKLFAMQYSVFQPSLRSEKVTNLHITIIFLLVCPGYIVHKHP